MVEPTDAIRAIHNAFRNDLKQIDAAALEAARGTPTGPTKDRSNGSHRPTVSLQDPPPQSARQGL